MPAWPTKFHIRVTLLILANFAFAASALAAFKLPRIDRPDLSEEIDSASYLASSDTLDKYKVELRNEFEAQPCIANQTSWTWSCQYRLLVEDVRFKQPPFDRLDPAEIFSISIYTQQAFREINPALRNEDAYALRKWNLTIRILVSALHKIPAFKSSPFQWDFYLKGAPLKRIVGGYAESSSDSETSWSKARAFFDSIPENGIFSDKAFMSTSIGADQRFKDALNKANLVITIHNARSGRAISQVSGLPWEQEVLFPPATEFRVIGKREVRLPNGKRQLQIDLDENMNIGLPLRRQSSALNDFAGEVASYEAN